jgi:putative CocE/NonD family hydrolase
MTTVAQARPASPPIHTPIVEWDLRIPARDGIELSANLWRPHPERLAVADGGVPVLLEMIPYGKDSWRRNDDVARGEWFARRGYAFCRVDVRGTGSSGGVALDEYTEAETLDGYDAVEWLAGQPWCNGRVAMWGISYGGFTAIQVAALGPPHLAAIVPFHATDDRYLDDIHYRGGCLTVSELSQYAVSQVAMNAMPPDPDFHGPGWREAWHARLAATPIWLFAWMRQQVDGPYWRRGSLAPDYDRLTVPTFIVGGWSDEYVDPVFRLAANVTRAPVRALVGNWVHGWPDSAFPGPNLDHLHEVVRFLDRHLKGHDAGWDAEPAITWFEREWAPPEPFPSAWPGRWRATSRFPHPETDERTWALGPTGTLGAGARTAGVDPLLHRPTVGTTAALSWGAGWPPNGLGRDQRPDEARSLTYTTAPLETAISILGTPRAELQVSATMPVATLVCRLMDVAPDGTPQQVSAGILNLSHRESHSDPAPLEPGEVVAVSIGLRSAGYRFAAGHRIRLVVSTAYWPVIWPSPLAGMIHVHHGPAAPSRLVLPTVPDAGGAGDLVPVPFRTSPPDVRSVGTGTEDPPVWRVVEDVLAGTVTVETFGGGSTVLEDGRELHASEALTMTASDADPAAAAFDSSVVYRWLGDDLSTEIRSAARLRSDAEAFALSIDLEVDLDGERFYERHQSERIPRRLV